MRPDDTPLDTLRIADRAVEALTELGFHTVGDVRTYLEQGGQLKHLNVHGLGPRGWRSLTEAVGRAAA